MRAGTIGGGQDTNQILATLNQIDWDFPDATTSRRSVHSLHFFPGNFIPQIPQYLIEVLSAPGQCVLDPFAGSGTTVIEAVRLGRYAIGLDACRAGTAVGRGKLGSFSQDVILELEKLDRGVPWQGIRRSPETPVPGDREFLLRWYDPDVLSQLSAIWQRVHGIRDVVCRAFVEMLFSDLLFACASPGGAVTRTGRRRRHHWGWVADNVKIARPVWYDAIQLFRRRLSAARAVVHYQLPEMSIGSGLIARSDARSLPLGPASVDLIVTSPPYLNMIDYAKANRLMYAWHGWPLETDKQIEIGARFKRRRKTALSDYLQGMAAAVRECARVLRPGGYCAVVIGSSRQNLEGLQRVFALFGEHLVPFWGPLSRRPTRRRVGDRGGTEPTEYIAVWRKS